MIVSGTGTGRPADLELLEEVSQTSTVPVIVGSGVSIDNVGDLLPFCHAVIVGSSIKGQAIDSPVDVDKVKQLVAAIR